MSSSVFHRRLLATAILFSLPTASVFANTSVQVAAAASLTDALNDAIAVYEAHHDVDVTSIYASSSTLARQIANGSPAQLFLSANVTWMDWLEEQNIHVQQRSDLLQNRLALVSASDSVPAQFTPGEGTAIETLLGERDRLSVGDPDHVPAGIYTQQALETLGEWVALAPRLARGNDVRAALALVEREETPVGVVYQTDAFASDAVRVLGLFPATSHDPITYPIALIDAEQNAAAIALREWLASEEALNIFAEHGFDTSISAP
ncbi:molybdate ABC transporter substrate-binding protein [Halomonas sp. QX-2]|uniref:Molybdate ABC transporter substrate-binding protein n=1 Tax=Vreelandella sedimenti TaxID=2729618 RepID=A0A7Z0N8D9_9GAMM|nr:MULTISPECIES: molybdate ABC transporter substrate-binding protein [Halomonas]NYT73069.1 molybdate ABC transporter substrate-binding protein [Halomonas sedimenti]|tara:strand:- start:15572 stop:16360 length:789 start_codon:yes stop_codon:yes gene_type:complete